MKSNNKGGVELLREPALNKSTAFTEDEKRAAGLVGLVPDTTETEDLQLRRVMLQLGHKTMDLDRYIYLTNLLDHNERLFYRQAPALHRLRRSAAPIPHAHVPGRRDQQ